MKVIIIEDTVYKVTDRQYKDILRIQDGARETSIEEYIIDIYLQQNKQNYNLVGVIDFDFRL